ncbi:nuclear transport factor 2 family protein [Vitreimonas flagellata]|uniref:nuclear transport factor 2 family protein n=1 Tax=Vitreimonas flagellata TaxID=2560861 RepID=UPI001074D2DA|nr:nuclear transport factor 2 family protein [Vitreimonas flagellata]
MTKFDPTAADPRIVGALAAREQLLAMFAVQNAEGLAPLLADDLLVNAPHNAVAERAAVLGFFRSGRMNYEDVVTELDFVGVRGESVVMMGLEVVRPREDASNAGKTVRRRFTDVWSRVGEQWRLSIRQATIIAVE